MKRTFETNVRNERSQKKRAVICPLSSLYRLSCTYCLAAQACFLPGLKHGHEATPLHAAALLAVHTIL